MKNWKKIVATGCSLTLIVSLLCGCSGTETKDTERNDKVSVIESEAEKIGDVADLVSHSEEAGKEETVYAIMDANGKWQETIVSEWLKNPNGEKSLQDTSSLTDIAVVKGDAKLRQSGDSLTWENDGSDIYYQGNAAKDLPVEVSVSYELDGKKVTADALSNVSGHLKLHFTYKNNTAKETTINKEKCTIYQPFLMVSGMMFDDEKVKNVTVDNGDAISSGDYTVAYGFAMPGLKESLDLTDIDEIPESVTVEADVTEYTLGMTLTFASNNLLSDLGLDDIDTVDDLKADVKKLNDGMNEMIDGVTELDTGSKKLNDGAKELSAGLTKLESNNKSLTDGVTELTDGINTLKGSLNSKESKQKLNTLVNGSKTFSGKLGDASDGLDAICTGYDYSKGDINKLILGLTQYANALEASGSAEYVAYAGYIKTLIATYESLYDNVSTAKQGVNALSVAYKDIDDGIGATKGSIGEVTTAVGKMSTGADKLRAGVFNYTAGVTSALAGAKELSKGTDSLKEGTGELKSGIIKFNKEGIQKISDWVNKDLDKYFNRLKAVQDYAEEYTSYAGCEEGVECSVKFIYKFDGVK